MKKLHYILLLLIPMAISLSGCQKDESAFDKSASQRTTELINSTFQTLTSAPDGWYFEHYNGRSAELELGGYFFWCDFKADNTVEAAAEFDVLGPEPVLPGETAGDTYMLGTVVESEYEIVPMRSATLCLNTYNPVLNYFAEPSAGMSQGYEGDVFFEVCSVKSDLIELRGIRSGKYMRLRKKMDDMTVQEAMQAYNDWGNAITNANPNKASVFPKEGYKFIEENYNKDKKNKEELITAITLTKDPAGARILTITITVEYFDELVENDEGGMGDFVEQDFSIRLLYAPKIDEDGNGIGITLERPVNIAGNIVSEFTYEGGGTFLSTDEWSNVELRFTGLNI